MIGIVIITHGALSSELLSTVKLIMGQQQDLEAVALMPNESIDSLREKSHATVEKYLEKGCLIMTDVLGGSPTNISLELLKTDSVRVLCGVNLPMVMSALQHRDNLDLVTLTARVREGAAKGIIDLKSFYEERAKKK